MATTITNTAAFAQYRRLYDATTTTANTTYSGAVTNTALLAVAGPDGSIITRISSIPRATVGLTQMQLFRSKDGGTTFWFFNTALMAAYTMAQTTAAVPTNFNNTDATTISETNPIPLTGMTNFRSTVTACGTSGGAANAQTLPFANISALTQYSVYDFEAGLTNTAGATLQLGTTAATAVIRDTTGSALSAGDITAGFRYRVWYDGSNLRLVITDRLYVAQGVTLAGGIVTSAQIADF